MIMKVLSFIFKAIIGFVMLISILLGCIGVSSILLTLTFYVLILVVGRKLCFMFIREEPLKTNLALLVITLGVSLLVGELALRYVFKIGLEKQELNGEFFYSLPYSGDFINKLARKYVLKIDDPLLTNRARYERSKVTTPEFEYTHLYNSLGLRGKDIDGSDSCYNIVSLGDSYTEGIGTPDDSTWSRLLEINLKPMRPLSNGYIMVQCINGGLSGSDPFSEYYILEKLLLPYHPKLVFVCINLTDITDVIKLGGWERYTAYKSPPWWGYIYQFSYITRAFMHGVFHVNWLLLTPEEIKMEEQKAIRLLYECILDNYVPLAKKHDIQLKVVLHPMFEELSDNSFRLSILSDSLTANHIQVINLFDTIKAVYPPSNCIDSLKSIYWLQDGHHNSKGYKLWADMITKDVFK